jgi:hypothetical protein
MRLERWIVPLAVVALALVAACDSGEDVPSDSASPTTITTLTNTPTPTAAASDLLTTIVPEAGAACEAFVTPVTDFGPLVAAYETTAGHIVDWQSWTAGTFESSSNYLAYPADKPVAVCLVSGVFRWSQPAPLPPATPNDTPGNCAMFLIPEGERTNVLPAVYGYDYSFTSDNMPKKAGDDSTVFIAP